MILCLCPEQIHPKAILQVARVLDSNFQRPRPCPTKTSRKPSTTSEISFLPLAYKRGNGSVDLFLNTPPDLAHEIPLSAPSSSPFHLPFPSSLQSSHGFHCHGATCSVCSFPLSLRPHPRPSPALIPTPDTPSIRPVPNPNGVSGDGGGLPAAGSAAAGGGGGRCAGGPLGADPEEGPVPARVPLPSERAAADAHTRARASAAAAEAERECGGRDAGVSRGDAAGRGAVVAR